MFDGNNLPYKLLLTARQKTKPRNAFENILSAGIKLSKTQISKITNFGGFLGSLLSKIAGPLMKEADPVAKNSLAPLGITTAASAVDAGFQKKIHGCGTTTLIISNEEINVIMKIVQALKYYILVTGIIRKEYKSIIRMNRDLMEFILEIMCLKKIKVGAYVINLDEYANIEAHWIGLYVSDSGATYFYSFGVEHIPKVIQKCIGNKNMQANIFRIQANNSVTCGYFCI